MISNCRDGRGKKTSGVKKKLLAGGFASLSDGGDYGVLSRREEAQDVPGALATPAVSRDASDMTSRDGLSQSDALCVMSVENVIPASVVAAGDNVAHENLVQKARLASCRLGAICVRCL